VVTTWPPLENGVPMAKMMKMEIAKGHDAVESLVIAAYDSPRYSTEEIKKEVLRVFVIKFI